MSTLRPQRSRGDKVRPGLMDFVRLPYVHWLRRASGRTFLLVIAPHAAVLLLDFHLGKLPAFAVACHICDVRVYSPTSTRPSSARTTPTTALGGARLGVFAVWACCREQRQ